MKNKYWNNSCDFKYKIISYIEQILKVYGNELTLKIEELNLLEKKDNCIKSSTAIGYCLEEFIVSKLLTYTNYHNNINEFKIIRDSLNTQNKSYDCKINLSNCLVLINIKANKSNNNAVAAINQLYKDYVTENPELIKHFMVLKLNYKIGQSKIDLKEKIIIQSISGYFLEEIDFSKGHRQDKRNWSNIYKSNSGRLQVNNKFLKNNKVNESEISYEKTKEFLSLIYNRNLT